MTPFIMNAKERIQIIIDGRDAGRWPNTSRFLSGASRIYGLLSQIRHRFYELGILKSHHLPCCVISVGNLTVGGTGKTPMTIYIARHLQSIGYRVAVLSRGYGGQSQIKGGIVSDGQSIYMNPDSAGDEAFMMAAKLIGIPVLVGKDRHRSGINAIQKFQAEVIVLDDGYQHLRLRRDLNLLLLDARRPFGNGHLLPRGPLRTALSRRIQADAIIFTRCQPGGRISALPKELDTPPSNVFCAMHKPVLFKVIASHPNGKSGTCPVSLTPLEASILIGKKVLAFSGIANNRDFKMSLLSFGVILNGFIEFDDHHRYTDQDIEEFRKGCQADGAQWLATTEKDFYRICHRLDSTIRMVVVGIEIEFLPNKDKFDQFLHGAYHASDRRT